MRELAWEQVWVNHDRKQFRQAKQMDFFQLARANLGLHSTNYWTPYISAWARLGDYDAASIYASLNAGKAITRMNAFRTTLHIVSNKDLLLITSATGPRLFKAVRQGPELRHMTDTQIEQRLTRFLGVLEKEPLSMQEMKAKAPSIAKHSRSLLWLAMARGSVVRANATHARNTICKYALTEKWVTDLEGEMIPEEEAVAAIFRRYVAAFGPVAPDDFAWWLPATKATVKHLIAAAGDDVQPCLVNGTIKYMFRDDLEIALSSEKKEDKRALFLPYEDHFPKAYADRSWYTSDDIRPKVFPRSPQAFWPQGAKPKKAMSDTGESTANASGEIRPSIWVDGRIVGRWEMDESDKRVRIVYSLFGSLPTEMTRAIASEQSRLEEFVNTQLMPISSSRKESSHEG